MPPHLSPLQCNLPRTGNHIGENCTVNTINNQKKHKTTNREAKVRDAEQARLYNSTYNCLIWEQVALIVFLAKSPVWFCKQVRPLPSDAIFVFYLQNLTWVVVMSSWFWSAVDVVLIYWLWEWHWVTWRRCLFSWECVEDRINRVMIERASCLSRLRSRLVPGSTFRLETGKEEVIKL